MEITLNIQFNKAMIKLEHPHETKKKKLNDPTITTNYVNIVNNTPDTHYGSVGVY